MELTDTVAMVSGASRGLGRALALRFAREGAAVSACARGEEDLREVEAEVREEGGRIVAVTTDVTDEEQVARWFDASVDRFGRVDAVVNNASILGPRVTIEEYPADTWRRVVEVNLTGAFLVSREAVPHLRATRGSLIHVSSGVGDHGRPRWGAYCAAKNGMEALSEMLAGELEEDGVRSNAVNPGSMRTEMRRAAYPEEDPETLPEPMEVTDVFVYLASNASRDVTGQRFRAKEFRWAAT